MTDWIDELNEQQQAKQKRQEHFRQVFPAKAGRAWNILVSWIKSDVAKWNARFGTQIRINGRDLDPEEDTLYLDKQAYPAKRLTLRLNTAAQILSLEQEAKESPEGQPILTKERLLLSLTSEDQISVEDVNGRLLTPKEASKMILCRFV